MDFEIEIRRYLTAVRKDVTAQIDSKDLIASGSMRRNFRVVANQHLAGEIRGLFYMRFYEKGFTKRAKSIGRLFLDNIINWMRFRGIQPKRNNKVLPNTETNIKRAAFGIARSLVLKGRKFEATRFININKALKDNVDPFLEDIGKEFIKEFDRNLKIK